MKELVIISGKGGTGKTSVTASFAVLAKNAVIADCDVDAADLHLILSPSIEERHDFIGGKQAQIKADKCIACGKCEELCNFDAIYFDGHGNKIVNETYRIDHIACEGCGVCAWFCPAKAIEFAPSVNGEWYVSQTRSGPMVHAKLGIAAENSGKLVSIVRQEARRIAETKKHQLIIVDGPPGIGCPVIASVTGATLVLIVTEPTVSGEHDLERVLALTKHFGIRTTVCVNKWDINQDMTARIEGKALQLGAEIAGRIRYDPSVTKAQLKALAVVEMEAPCAEDIKKIWEHLAL